MADVSDEAYLIIEKAVSDLRSAGISLGEAAPHRVLAWTAFAALAELPTGREDLTKLRTMLDQHIDELDGLREQPVTVPQ